MLVTNNILNQKQRNYYTAKEVLTIVFDSNLSMTTLHKLMQSGQIPCIQLCRKRLIPAWWVEKQIATGRGSNE